MRTTPKPRTQAPTISVNHWQVEHDADYRHELRARLVLALDRAEAAQSTALVPVLLGVHEPSGSCCQLEKFETTIARLTGALKAARPRY